MTDLLDLIEAGARSEHELRGAGEGLHVADRTRPVPGQMRQGDRLRLEIVEQQALAQAERVCDLPAVQRPVRIGHAHRAALDRPCCADEQGTGGNLRAFLHYLDRRKEARMGRRGGIADMPDLIAGFLGQSHADIRAADVAHEQGMWKVQGGAPHAASAAERHET